MGIVQFYTDHIEESQPVDRKAGMKQVNFLINGDKPIAGKVERKVGYKYIFIRYGVMVA